MHQDSRGAVCTVTHHPGKTTDISCRPSDVSAHARETVWLVSNNSRFLFRHFRPVINAALDCKFRTIALLPRVDHECEFAEGVEILRIPISRYLRVLDFIVQSSWMTLRLAQARPTVVVAFSVRTALAVIPALIFLRNTKIVIYVTGLGLLAIVNDLRSRLLRKASFLMLRIARHHPNCYFVFENRSDPLVIGFKQPDFSRQITVAGAGVDLAEFSLQKYPSLQPFKLAIVSRLIWSKGIDLAAQAVSELGREGYSIELNIYGEPDVANPRSIDPRDWMDNPHVKFLGYATDIPEVWARHHAAIFPSRGGEGIPRALLEAAACGRPCIVTNVPGCAEFVRHGVEGFVAKPESVESLKQAIVALLQNQCALQTMGMAARNRVIELSSREIIEGKFRELFTSLVDTKID